MMSSLSFGRLHGPQGKLKMAAREIMKRCDEIENIFKKTRKELESNEAKMLSAISKIKAATFVLMEQKDHQMAEEEKE